MHLVSYQQDMNMCRYERHMEDKYRKQMKRSGYSKLLYNQRNKNETIRFSDKTTVWGAHYIKISEDTE